MHLICSAFLQGAEPNDNAVATAHLIHSARPYKAELCLGVYKGQREMSVKLTGFESLSEAISEGQAIISAFGQECVLLVNGNTAHSITARGVVHLGTVCRTTTCPQEAGAESYTQFLDGTYLHVEAAESAQDNEFALAA